MRHLVRQLAQKQTFVSFSLSVMTGLLHIFLAGGASWWFVLAMMVWYSLLILAPVRAVPATAPERCGASGCTLDNAYRLWNDRIPCKAAEVVYPTTEGEIVAAVASAARANQKVKVATVYGHSIPKGACPGSDTGVIISSRNYNQITSIDAASNTVTAQSGITWRALLDGMAEANLAINVAPFFDGATLGGAIANGVHGSSLWGRGGAVHEYVVGMTIVTPANESQGFAKVREIGSDDLDLNAAKVHLGVLGVVSTVTLLVEPLFKRRVAMVRTKEGDDAGLTGAKILEIATEFQYGEVLWYPGLRQVVYKLDNRVSVSTPGDGRNNYFGLQSQLQPALEIIRINEEVADERSCRDCKCILALAQVVAQQAVSYGYEKNNNFPGLPNPDLTGLILGFPVVGKQTSMSTSGGCQRDTKPLFYCSWDHRINGLVLNEANAALPLRHVGSFIDDIRALRARAPNGSLCDLDLYTGILFRFAKQTQAYMGTAQEDAVMLDFAWSRARRDVDATKPRLDMDVFQEIEQLAFDKYGARPHWGKNRNYVFDGAWTKYPNLSKFLAVKQKFDPQGIFSSEWSDAVLGIAGSPVSDGTGCAVEGNCKCSKNEHCAAGEMTRLVCSSGLVFTNAKVCH